MQPRRHSFAEALTQVTTGAFLSWLLTIYVLPIWFDGIHIGAGTALEITVVYLLVSLVRSYVLRRAFNR